MRKRIPFYIIKLGGFWLDVNGGWYCEVWEHTWKTNDKKEAEKKLKKLQLGGFNPVIEER